MSRLKVQNDIQKRTGLNKRVENTEKRQREREEERLVDKKTQNDVAFLTWGEEQGGERRGKKGGMGEGREGRRVTREKV